MSAKLKVLIVDDSRSYQLLVQRVLEEIDGVEVVGKASNGNMALRMTRLNKPDLITLDVEMPVMDGLETLKKLKAKHPEVQVIMVSALTIEGAQVTLKALEAGAFDFINKPSMGSADANHRELLNQLNPKIRTLLRRVPRPTTPSTPIRERPKELTSEVLTAKPKSRVRPFSGTALSAVGIGISTGGPNALKEVLPKIPAGFRAPILIVQHMPPMFTKALADSLDQKCALSVREAVDGEAVLPGHVYIAPGGKQMKVDRPGPSLVIKITDDPPEKNCKPSVDYLFRSLATHCKGGVLGVIMTGMGNDGTLGLKLMKRHGAPVIAQDESTSTVFGMPMEAIKAGVVDTILPLGRIADGIQNYFVRK